MQPPKLLLKTAAAADWLREYGYDNQPEWQLTLDPTATSGSCLHTAAAADDDDDNDNVATLEFSKLLEKVFRDISERCDFTMMSYMHGANHDVIQSCMCRFSYE